MIHGDFEWDDAKAAANLAKHGIDFRDATLAFLDPAVVLRQDDRHDYGEDRWIAIGATPFGVLLSVCHIEHDRIRIISARFASRQEQALYLDRP